MTDERLFLTVDDYEPVARELLSEAVYGYYAGGAGDEWTLAENLRAFERWMIRPRMLRGSGTPDTSTELFGSRVSMPVLVAPWAYQSMAHPDGEEGTARAAAESGTIMVVSTTAMDQVAEIAGITSAPKWWQLYVMRDRSVTHDLLDRVAAAGYEALVWTVDFPVAGLRHRDARTGFELPIGLPTSDLEFDPHMTWDDLGWIRERASGVKILVKGILTAEDAELAVQAGADGICVSNHGGRQLDRVPAGITALPEVAAQVAGRVPVLMDGGVRRGVDVLTALALGADAVMIGRPVAWALAVGGERGVRDVLGIMAGEVENAMALAGCRTVADITRDLVMPAPR